MTARASSPHPGRSYTSRSGAIARVDYVKPSGDVCYVLFGPEDGRHGGDLWRLSGEDFEKLAAAHDFQPVRCADAGAHMGRPG